MDMNIEEPQRVEPLTLNLLGPERRTVNSSILSEHERSDSRQPGRGAMANGNMVDSVLPEASDDVHQALAT